METFLFFLFLAGIIVASIQDLKKREVDNWVNYFLLISGWVFVLFKSILNFDFYLLLAGLICFAVCFALGNAFYFGRVFAGGDAKLLIAMFSLFVSAGILRSLANIGIFIVFLLVSGSIYGLGYSLFFYFRDFFKINKQIKKEFGNKYLKYGMIFGAVLITIAYFNLLFLFVGIFALLVCALFAFAKSIEKISMIKEINAHDLREGDWLAENVKSKGKLFKYCWDGLSEKELRILKKLRRKIKIKDGIAFIPAFLIAFIMYLYKEQVIGWVLRIIS
jgi:Flp pilus assembly protein protease CpaA